MKTNSVRSFVWTFVLIPFLFLPYRWLWVLCALAGTAIALPRRSCSEAFRRDGTLIIGSLVVLILRTALDPGWWLPWFAVILLLCWLRSRTWWSAKPAIPAVVAIWIASACLLVRPTGWPLHGDVQNSPSPQAIVVCAGDSLTSGVGGRSDDDTYVAHLRERLGCQVINAGVASNRTGDLLARLDKDVLSHKPTVVLLFIGGNDYLDGTPRKQFAQQLKSVASRIDAAGSKLVVVEVPTGIIWDPYAGIYRKAARRHGGILVPESRLRCWYSVELLARDSLKNPLTIDGIHLSPAGAIKVADWLEPYLLRALAEH